MTGEILSDIEKAKHNLEFTLHKNAKYYHQLTNTTEALTVGHLAATDRGRELVVSSDFKDLVGVVDWPNKQDREQMTWELSFEDGPEGDIAFAEAFLGSPDRINNAKCYMFTKAYTVDTLPKAPDAQGGMAQFTYGSAPCKMRAELVSPELFTSIRGFYEQVKWGDVATYLEDNPDTSKPVISAMRVAYMLLGRCVRSDDEKTHMKLLFGPDRDDVNITDISQHLYK
ncbi:MAG: hypothetical protein ABIQ64_01215 [Candidatus Saccharimonadales bacterium]